jgi:drug/metabolite transporter (DMT)-like permease
VIAIVGGLATAALWATTLLVSARATRLIGPWSTLAWVMLVGLLVTVPLIALTSPPVAFTTDTVLHLAVAGFANAAGLPLVYAALGRGKVGVVGPIVSTEGAIAAVLAILAGDPVTAGVVALLAVIALGVAMAATEPAEEAIESVVGPTEPAVAGADTSVRDAGRSATLVTAGLALGGALLFGVNLYATSRIASELPIAWAVLPARLVGVLFVTLPLLVTRRAVLTRPAVPLVIVIGLAEVAGVATFAIGARSSAAVTAVIASQFAAIAAVAAYVMFGERLGRLQVAGVATIAVGVALLAAVQA